MAAPVFGVTDVLALSTGWEPQNASPTDAPTRATAVGGDGDIVAETTHNTIESGTASYIYTGEETDFAAAFAASSCDVGDVVNTSFIITGIAVDYSPCAAGQQPMVTFTYRTGEAGDTPFVYTTDLTLPTYVAANVVVPAILTDTPGDAEIQSSNWGLTMQYGEDLDKDGEALSGQGYGGEETLNLSYVGTPTAITSTGWQQTSGPGTTTGETASNTAYGTASYTFVRAVTRT